MKAAKRASVKVPASTSNLGAGFDCFGVAVDRWLTASVVVGTHKGPDTVTITRSGTVTDLSESGEEDLVHTGFALTCEARGHPVPSRLEYTVNSSIPTARGLGSSAAALIAGAMLANEALELKLRPAEIASLCARAEGHPDNAGAAVFGGPVLSVKLRRDHGDEFSFSPLAIHPELKLVFVVPDVEMETAAARAVLPSSLPYETTVAAIAKAAALVRGLENADAGLLAFALEDVVHVPFRRHLIPGYEQVIAAAVSSGAFGATLSGSGSTIVAVAAANNAARIASAMQKEWERLGTTAEVIIGAGDVPGAVSTAR